MSEYFDKVKALFGPDIRLALGIAFGLGLGFGGGGSAIVGTILNGTHEHDKFATIEWVNEHFAKLYETKHEIALIKQLDKTILEKYTRMLVQHEKITSDHIKHEKRGDVAFSDIERLKEDIKDLRQLIRTYGYRK